MLLVWNKSVTIQDIKFIEFFTGVNVNVMFPRKKQAMKDQKRSTGIDVLFL
jgi:hypothetical protein